MTHLRGVAGAARPCAAHAGGSANRDHAPSVDRHIAGKMKLGSVTKHQFSIEESSFSIEESSCLCQLIKLNSIQFN